jgi:zinc transporter 1/2/3
LHVPKAVFEFAKYFGSGVIIATAFIHLLSPSISELTSPCLSPAWQEYPYSLAFALLSIFGIFIVELIAFRWGTAKLTALNMTHDPHGHQVGSHVAHGPEGDDRRGEEYTTGNEVPEKKVDDIESVHKAKHMDATAAGQIIGVFILEFGAVLHR